MDVNLTLKLEEVTAILEFLGDLPISSNAYFIYNNIQMQVNPQIQAAENEKQSNPEPV